MHKNLQINVCLLRPHTQMSEYVHEQIFSQSHRRFVILTHEGIISVSLKKWVRNEQNVSGPSAFSQNSHQNQKANNLAEKDATAEPGANDKNQKPL